MNKELEEAALIYASKPRQFGVRMTFIDGAKWQAERMYSIEFLMWYSGMNQQQIENAHKRWINETFKSE